MGQMVRRTHCAEPLKREICIVVPKIDYSGERSVLRLGLGTRHVQRIRTSIANGRLFLKCFEIVF